MTALRSGDARVQPSAPLSVGQRNLMMVILVLVMTVGAMDRAIVATVIEPIKHEFGLSDSQLGFITGLAFALVHAFVVIPFGVLADRTNRRKLVAAALAVWSLMTALCGVAQSYVQLVLARMGVGAGEAGGQSAALSMVSDLYPPEKRATAVGIYYMAFPIGGTLAAVVGGLVAADYGWRSALLVASAPGFLLALGLVLFGRDPPRQGATAAQAKGDAPSLIEVLRFMRSQRSMMHLMAAMAITHIAGAGQSMFAFAFFMRYHHMNLHTLGPLIGGGHMLGMIPLLLGGLLADRLGRRDPRWRVAVIAGALLIAGPLLVACFAAPTAWALPLYLAHFLVLSAWLGPSMAEVQNLATARMRATVAGVMYMINGLVGYGLGPVVVGAASDWLQPSVGAQALRYALILVTGLWLWAVAHYWASTRRLRADLARAAAG